MWCSQWAAPHNPEYRTPIFLSSAHGHQVPFEVGIEEVLSRKRLCASGKVSTKGLRGRERTEKTLVEIRVYRDNRADDNSDSWGLLGYASAVTSSRARVKSRVQLLYSAAY